MARRRPGLQPDFGLPVFMAAAAKVALAERLAPSARGS
jgi:hypothetical protein